MNSAKGILQRLNLEKNEESVILSSESEEEEVREDNVDSDMIVMV